MSDQGFVAVTVECQHCKAKQKVLVVARARAAQIGKQNIVCIECKEDFDVTGPRQDRWRAIAPARHPTVTIVLHVQSNSWYLSRIVTEASQRFDERLATQFEMIERNLNECEDAVERRNVLRGLMVLLDQIDDIVAQQQPLPSDSKLDRETAINPPLTKAAGQ